MAITKLKSAGQRRAQDFAHTRVMAERKRQIRADQSAASDFESIVMDAAILRRDGFKELGALAVAQKLENAAHCVARANRVAAAAARMAAMIKPKKKSTAGLGWRGK